MSPTTSLPVFSVAKNATQFDRKKKSNLQMVGPFRRISHSPIHLPVPWFSLRIVHQALLLSMWTFRLGLQAHTFYIDTNLRHRGRRFTCRQQFQMSLCRENRVYLNADQLCDATQTFAHGLDLLNIFKMHETLSHITTMGDTATAMSQTITTTTTASAIAEN